MAACDSKAEQVYVGVLGPRALEKRTVLASVEGRAIERVCMVQAGSDITISDKGKELNYQMHDETFC